jgi:hypothetical protein
MTICKVSDRKWLSWPGIPFRPRVALLGAALVLFATAHNAAAQGCRNDYLAGDDDNYAPPSESTTPDTALAGVPCGTGDVATDVPAVNQCVRHTFANLGVICGATLTIGLKPTNVGSDNDDLALYVDDGTANPPTGVYTSRISSLPNATPPTGGSWNTTSNPGGSTFVLDLANLPPSGANLINQINSAGLGATGLLDVLVEDDTEVDFIIIS